MKRVALVLSLVWFAGCSNHSVEPTQEYDAASKIPVVENVIVIPGPGGNFDVTWEYDDSIFKVVDGFFIERAPFLDALVVGEFERLNQGLFQQREFEDRGGLPEGKYAYRIYSETGAGIRSHASELGVGIVDLQPPSPPTLTAQVVVLSNPQGVDSQAVELSWTAAEDDVVFYRLYRSPSFLGGLVFIEWTKLEFNDAAVDPKTVYHYWVTAVDGGLNESVNSNIESVQIDF